MATADGTWICMHFSKNGDKGSIIGKSLIHAKEFRQRRNAYHRRDVESVNATSQSQFSDIVITEGREISKHLLVLCGGFPRYVM